MPENQPVPNPESKIEGVNLYEKPHEIAERIRKLKEEYFSTQRLPGAERKIEITEEYENLKAKREDTKEVILENLIKINEKIENPVSAAKKQMESARESMENAQVLGNNDDFKEAQKGWYEAYDFVRLFERKNEYLMDMNLENED